MQITRFPNLTASQFSGCLAAFVDTLAGELNATVLALHKLENQPKGSAFAFEMELDIHRYGALMVIDRWATFVDAFAADPALAEQRDIITRAPAQVQTAEAILNRANALIDASPQYTPEVISACVMACQALELTFDVERAAAKQSAQLGPMLPDDYRQARRIFLEDLSAR